MKPITTIQDLEDYCRSKKYPPRMRSTIVENKDGKRQFAVMIFNSFISGDGRGDKLVDALAQAIAKFEEAEQRWAREEENRS